MHKHLIVAFVAGAFALAALGADAASENAELPHARPTEVVVPNVAQLQQVGAVNAVQLERAQAATEDLRNRVEANARAYEERMQRALGDRAPTETIPPMATVPPPPPPN